MLAQTTIVYMADNLGVVGGDGAVFTGDIGRYLGPLPDDGWHTTEPSKYPGKMCPVTEDMFRAAQ